MTAVTETLDPIVGRANPSLMRKTQQASEQRQREIQARYAAKRQSLNRSHPFRNLNARKTVMERILGNRVGVLSNMFGSEPSR